MRYGMRHGPVCETCHPRARYGLALSRPTAGAPVRRSPGCPGSASGRGLPPPDVEAALRVAAGGVVPGLTLILDIPVTVGRPRQRPAGRQRDRSEREAEAWPTTSPTT